MSPKNIYEQSIDKMQRSIARLQSQLKRSRQLLDHDITIDNRTQQNLNFTIKLSDQDENHTYKLTESKVMIPYHSALRHRINTVPRQHSNSPSPSSQSRYREGVPVYFSYNGSPPKDNGHRVNFNSELYRSAASKQSLDSGKNQRKFQPFNQIEQDSPHRQRKQHIITEYVQSDSKTDNVTHVDGLRSAQNLHPSRITGSSVEQESVSEEMNLAHAQDLKHIEKNIIPLSMYQTKKADPFSTVEESPQVYNYLQERPTKYHHEIYTPPTSHVEELKPMGITFSPKAYESGRAPQQKKWSIQPSTVGYQNNKKYFETVTERQQFMKCREYERKKRIHTEKSPPQSKSKDKQFEYISRFEKQPKTHKKQRADDLFLERKNMFLKNLTNSREKLNTVKKQNERMRSKSQKDMLTSRKSSKLEIANKKQMSPKVKELSQRLYSRSKEKLIPCEHYRRHGESIERERFYSLIHQNSFVRKYVTTEEQQALFQQFRREEDPVSAWPMKLTNYTYSKLKKINGASRYTVKKEYY